MTTRDRWSAVVFGGLVLSCLCWGLASGAFRTRAYAGAPAPFQQVIGDLPELQDNSDKLWLVTTRLDGKEFQWETSSYFALPHGYYRLVVDKKEICVPIAATIVEERR